MFVNIFYTFQGSDVWLPESGFFVGAFVEANHGEVVLEHGHVCFSVWGTLLLFKINSFAAKYIFKLKKIISNEQKKLEQKFLG